MQNNKGFFFGRYEASQGTGSTFGLGVNDTYYKPKSVKGSSVWKNLTKENAITASRQMYYNNSYIESDLVNSYMWDTAIVYIQAMGNTNYANADRGSNTSLKNSGGTGDVKCNINDMASNVREWTTEYSTENNYPFAYRSGSYAYNYHTAYRNGISTSYTTNTDVGFRIGLWIKNPVS